MTQDALSITVDTAGLDAMFDSMQDSLDTAARPASQAGAQVLYEAVLRNVNALGRKTGNLASSIYQVYSQDNSGPGYATYHISWNAKKAPHGHLLEFGYLQRYKYFKGDDGVVRPMVRPEKQGTPKPGRRASQAVKDAYYVTLPTPRQVPAKAFVRRAADFLPQAAAAAELVLLDHINEA